jgi:hypothetical protein
MYTISCEERTEFCMLIIRNSAFKGMNLLISILVFLFFLRSLIFVLSSTSLTKVCYVLPDIDLITVKNVADFYETEPRSHANRGQFTFVLRPVRYSLA